MSAIISAVRASRWYGQVIGVNDLTVDIDPGITGLLGPNGAGKSTFLKLVTGQLRPSRGTVKVLGHVPFANRDLFRQLGFCPEHDALYDDMTGVEFVVFALRLHGFPKGDARQRALESLDRVGLRDAMTRRIHGYSKGMRQRLKIAQAITHRPRLLILDEPMTGLDPVMRSHLLALFRELAREGTDLLVSSHVLHEIEALTDRILLIHRGRVLAHGTVAQTRRLLDRHPRRLRIRARDARGLARLLLGQDGVCSVRLEDDAAGLLIETRDLEALQRSLPSLIAGARPGIQAVEVTDAGLESVFEYLVS